VAEEKYSGGSHRVGGSQAVARSKESRVVKLALGLALPSCPNDYLCHRETALPGER